MDVAISQSKVMSEIIQDGNELEERWVRLLTSVDNHKKDVQGEVELEERLERYLVPYKQRMEELELVIKTNLEYLEKCRDAHRFRELGNNRDSIHRLFRLWNSMKFNNFLDELLLHSTEKILVTLIKHHKEDIPQIIIQLKQKSSQIIYNEIASMYIMGARHH